MNGRTHCALFGSKINMFPGIPEGEPKAKSLVFTRSSLHKLSRSRRRVMLSNVPR